MEPELSARAPGYDLFKLIVAIILLLLFLLLSWRQTPQSAIPLYATWTSTSFLSSEALSPTPAIAPTASLSLLSTAALNPISSPQDTLPSITRPATAIPISSSTQTNIAPTNTSAIIATPLPSLTVTPVIELTATPNVAIPSNLDVCEAAGSRSRLKVGMNATILRRLNFRSSPGIRDNWLLTNIPGTRVEIVGGPECVPHFTGAYVWWHIKLPNGRIGWSAEASLLGSFYFIEPAK